MCHLSPLFPTNNYVNTYTGVHFAGLLDVQNILSADTGISRQTEGNSFSAYLQWVSQCYAIEFDSFYCALFCVFMTRVNQGPISLRAEHSLHIGADALEPLLRFTRIGLSRVKRSPLPRETTLSVA
jgi:hypothetical protein